MYKKSLIALSLINFVCIMPFSPDIDDKTSVAQYKDAYKAKIKKICKSLYQLDDDLAKKHGHINDELLSSLLEEDEELLPIDLVLLHKNEVIGFCSFDSNEFNLDGHIYMIAIDKNYRRQGFGEKFLLKILEIHKEIGMKTISLRCHEVGNSAGRKLYKKLGFEEISFSSDSGIIDFKKVL